MHSVITDSVDYSVSMVTDTVFGADSPVNTIWFHSLNDHRTLYDVFHLNDAQIRNEWITSTEIITTPVTDLPISVVVTAFILIFAVMVMAFSVNIGSQRGSRRSAYYPSMRQSALLIVLMNFVPCDLSSETTLYTGYTNTCQVTDGDISCWGSGDYGILGLESTDDLFSATIAPIALDDFEVISASISPSHICALSSNGTVRCWGYNNDGQLGYGNTDSIGTTNGSMANCVDIDLGSDFGSVSTIVVGSYYFSCALSTDTNSLGCWGNNSYGQLGIGHENDIGDDPDEMGDNLQNVDLGAFVPVEIKTSYYHVCALSDSGDLKCWGANFAGELGLGDYENRGDDPDEMGDNLPIVDLGDGFIVWKFDCGAFHNCVIGNTSIGSTGVKCFGNNGYGQLGYGGTGDKGNGANEMGDNLDFVELGTDFVPFDLSLGASHSCYISTLGEIKCFGRNDYGQLGYGDTASRGDGSNEMG